METNTYEEEKSLGLPETVKAIIESTLGSETKVNFETLYNTIDIMVNDEFFNLDFSLSEVDVELFSILNDEERTNDSLIIALRGFMLRLAKKICSLSGVELVDLDQLDSGIAISILNVLSLLPNLELGLEGEVITLCDSVDNTTEDIEFEFSKVLANFGKYTPIEYYDMIESVSLSFLHKLRKYLEDRTLEPNDNEALDRLNFLNEVGFKFNITSPFSDGNDDVVGIKPIIHCVPEDFIDELITNRLLFKPFETILTYVENYIVKKINKQSVTNYLIVALAYMSSLESKNSIIPVGEILKQNQVGLMLANISLKSEEVRTAERQPTDKEILDLANHAERYIYNVIEGNRRM